ncbi:MAG: PEP-CTERM sorting domain-containing protein [Sedimentisphaerales bacterium]|nr:PEP-CTERM sorting domain-containing protein [Sedimentisphaerales bacterium]
MKHICISLLVVFLGVQLVSADYNNPPGWENNPYFTHQSWSFTDASNPSAPDPGFISPGSPSFNLTAANRTWVDDIGLVYDFGGNPLGTRQGGWKIEGPSTDEVWFTVDIPNEPNPHMYKELWFELTFRVTDMTHAGSITNDVDLQVYAEGIIDGDHKFDYLGDLGGAFGIDINGHIWLRFEGTFRYDPQPPWEQIMLTGSVADGQQVLLDQIDIDTRCVPEPTTMGLLGMGVFALLRRRKRR